MPGTDSQKIPVDPGLVARLTTAWRVLMGQDTGPATQERQAINDAWQGPGLPNTPSVPVEQAESVQNRSWDFPAGYNVRIRPRAEEAVTFTQMRALADSCDILRLVVETRKDQVAKMKFTVNPIQDPNAPPGQQKKPDARCKEVEDFFKMPDGFHGWDDWVRMLLEEMFITDAATIYPWLNNDGTPFRFDLIDGSTIKRVIDERGRTPPPGFPAYQQVLKGVIVANYDCDELVYAPRNPRVHKVYGYSPVEQIVMTVNIALRRAIHQLQYYTEGSVPDLLFQVPADWNMTQIKEFNDWWNEMLAGNTANRRRAQFVPNGVTPVNTKDAILKDPYDEWLARIVCYCFGVSPQPFIKENNRSTSETAHEMALEEGLYPVLQWIQSVLNRLIWKYFGYKDLEFKWEDQDATSPDVQSKIDDTNVKNGTATINEVRAKRGDAPVDGGDVAMCLTATGYVPIKPEEMEPGTVIGPTGEKLPPNHPSNPLNKPEPAPATGAAGAPPPGPGGTAAPAPAAAPAAGKGAATDETKKGGVEADGSYMRFRKAGQACQTHRQGHPYP